MSTNR